MNPQDSHVESEIHRKAAAPQNYSLPIHLQINHSPNPNENPESGKGKPRVVNQLSRPDQRPSTQALTNLLRTPLQFVQQSNHKAPKSLKSPFFIAFLNQHLRKNLLKSCSEAPFKPPIVDVFVPFSAGN